MDASEKTKHGTTSHSPHLSLILRVFLVLGLASLEFEANAQFRFPQLPSPPRIIFGGFRPFFPRPRPRPRPPRPPFLVPSSQFLQQQQQQNRFPQRPFSGPLASLFDFGRPPRPTRPQRPPPPPSRRPPSPPLPPLQSNSISPPLTFGPPPAAQQFSPARPALSAPPPSFQQTNDLSFRPPQVVTSQNPIISVDGFGAPRPDSIVSISQLPSQQQARPLLPRPSPQPSPQQFTVTLSSCPPPLIGPSSNNIIGMTPPPPPAPSVPPTPPPTPPPLPPQTTVVVTVTQPSTIGPLVPITARPSRPLSPPSSNALDDLLVNPVPSLNAGILPLANEKPSETQLFPPFT
ncbi:uncharacterized protein LOC135210673 [Macrobrachium nipponense]|uniref:uncharacterized protein LOC135210673 n=1 Tax=Macrobrachium nipponense TaxID=159736 RepID=UPI0030C8A4A7